MAHKKSKEEWAAREALIAAGIAQVGLKKLDYQGEPTDHKTWRKKTESKRYANRAKDKTDRGIGADTARDRFQLKEAKKDG
jgi:hypothetical protein